MSKGTTVNFHHPKGTCHTQEATSMRKESYAIGPR
jgi:hypothetical protein